MRSNTGLTIETVKSNFGTSVFIPVDGRWGRGKNHCMVYRNAEDAQKL
ncbi:MAG: hypothetical protein K2G67_04630 [Muribaculaceae bacterium]|nr:hypothetical protein [Muribaculaceae bacterium]